MRHSVEAISLVTVRRYASVVYAIVVCLSVCLSHSGIVSKRLNIGSRKQSYTIAQGSIFLMPKITANYNGIIPFTGVPKTGGVR